MIPDPSALSGCAHEAPAAKQCTAPPSDQTRETASLSKEGNITSDFTGKAEAIQPNNHFHGNYLTINGRYYQLITYPGNKSPSLVSVNRAHICDLFPDKTDRLAIPSFLDFATVPNNTPTYQQIIQTASGRFWNDYAAPVYAPVAGNFPHIKTFMQHLFGTQTDLALDFMRLLYVEPNQRLPVLVLVSAERATGKTTFLQLLQAIFGDNAVIIDNQTLASRFNSKWAGKLVVGVDEALINRRDTTEMIKDIATARTVWVEAKGRNRREKQNYMHLIINSNNLTDPLMIDLEENRYWVVQVPPFTDEEKEPNALDLMVEEIPAFLHYLLYEHRMTYQYKQSRLWFPPEAYRSEALLRIQHATMPSGHQLLATVLADLMAEIGQDSVCLSYSLVQVMLSQRGLRSIKVLPILKEWRSSGVADSDNKTYQTYVSCDGKTLHTPVKQTGRFYTFFLSRLEKYL